MSLRIPNGLINYFTIALEFISGAQAVEQIVLGLSMLSVVPEEVEAADVSRTVQLELQDQLINFSLQFAVMVDQLSEKALTSRELFIALLKQITTWLSSGSPPFV